VVDIAVLFADVRGSTNLGEGTRAVAFASLMNRFYATATNVLLQHDALIDKLIGGEVMALFIPGVWMCHAQRPPPKRDSRAHGVERLASSHCGRRSAGPFDVVAAKRVHAPHRTKSMARIGGARNGTAVSVFDGDPRV